MSDIAIRVENLSKAYRIGLKEQIPDTLVGAMASWMRSPWRNFNNLRRLNTFRANGDAEDIVWALRDVSFDVKEGEVIGIIGRNGAGKSTLLKILSRITDPTSGMATIRGRVSSLLEVGTGFHPELTGRENIYMNGTILGMSKREIDRKFDEIVDFSGVEKFLDTPIKRYSSGMKVRLAFSVAAHLEPEILIIDEVLAVGDAEFQKKCLGRMSEVSHEGRTVLFVSHNLEAVLTLCSRGLVIQRGCVAFDGPSQAAVDTYRRTTAGSLCSAVYNWTVDGDGIRGTGITRIELLDTFRRPCSSVGTWDDVIFRVHYRVSQDVPGGTIVLDIRDYKDQRLLVFDSGQRVPIEAGDHFVDCIVPGLPLAAGDYYLAVGLAIGNSGWISRKTDIGCLMVNGRDVYHLGRPPHYSRMAFAARHDWQSAE
ncbi:MAG: ABC transporter ATP-binding protein [Bryobacteraceae bacterium]|nr:ABC transporter ATP-binding protein [Bryobacteraceae bacterium]